MLAALVAGSLTSIQPTAIRAEDGAQLVYDFHAAFGKHHARANHTFCVIRPGMVFAEGCMEVIDQLRAFLSANCSRPD